MCKDAWILVPALVLATPSLFIVGRAIWRHFRCDPWDRMRVCETSIDSLAARAASILTERLEAKDVLRLLEIVFLDYNEVAQLLRVKRKTVEEWVSQNKIPYRKANGRVLFLLSELLAWTLPDDDRQGRHRLSVAAASKLTGNHLAATRERKK